MKPFGMDNFPEVINAPKSKTDEATRPVAARNAVDARVSEFRRADPWDLRYRIMQAASDVTDAHQAADYVFEIFTGRGPMHTDYTGMSLELVQKVAARERAMDSDEARSTRGGPVQTGATHAVLSVLGVLAAVVMALAAVLYLAVVCSRVDGGFFDRASVPALAALLISTATFASTIAARQAIARRQSLRSELALTQDEFELVKNARSRIGIDQNPDRRLDEAAAISATAAEVIHAIRKSPAWSSEHLDVDRIQLDLNEELYQITRACNQLRKLSKSCESVQPDQRDDSPLADKLAEQAAEYRSLYDEAREAIIARIVALYVYRERLVSVEGLLANIAIASKAVAGNDDFAETFTSITQNREAAKRIDKLSVGLDDLRERLSVELDLIRGEIVASAELGAPLVLLSERAA